jgi:hypothetical protein
MRVSNRSGTAFDVMVEREVGTADPSALGVTVPDGVKWVGFQTTSIVSNRGERPWTKSAGALSVWILGMFNPSPDAVVIVPFEARDPAAPVVNDRYFGKVPEDRLAVHQDKGFLAFRADGKHRSKIGLGPARAKDVLGSYSAEARLLTIVRFTKPQNRTDYVNSMWEDQREPFGGDVVNSYNDGPTEPGKPSLGGFYELETSSPAAALEPGAAVRHVHATFHFVGDKAELDAIARKVLGVSLGDM